MSIKASSPVAGKAPDLGAFPLDHYRECKAQIAAYYKCLEEHNFLTPMCRDDVRRYLSCRMEKGLMKENDFESFNLPNTKFVPTRQHKEDLKEQWLKQKMNQVTAVWEENYKRENLTVPDGYEVSPEEYKEMKKQHKTE
ncbi:hypothetical protein AGDE_06413 [Angomonas deanei]|uniref:Cytochrome c oxidase assembly protein COX19 n=1 Tax=Angomonas deanei TaxID=59799 RepID=S9WEC1_9TRYP|nr:hypothetical protein AGDE_11674 [Angomonas deanei]EPY37521.1 hypothetical protein AGDE_06413 [Angomonas deanei]CAD2217602.1 hypothetical protein, conserved [Angomonas deanei]|eukprot:EPY25834.1 hypothetical protein AGDE_11674 [Angomonas deanei]